MKKVVIDTSIFVNPQSRKAFANDTFGALVCFLDLLKENPLIACYMPPLVYEELMKFLEDKVVPAQKAVLINKKAASSYQGTIPALLFYEFVEEMRSRVNKGLRVAEKFTRRGISDKEEETIKSLREEYRLALREGIIDSREDFDLILLAKELGAYLATSDNGLVKWAHKLGINCIDAGELKEIVSQKL